MHDSTELQQAENDNSAASQSEHIFQELHRDTEYMLIQESSEEEQIKHTSDYRHDIFSSDQTADQQKSVVLQQIEELQNHTVLQLL